MRLLPFVLACSATLIASPALAWGAIGHRVTGAVADENLSGVARARIRLLLGEEDLAQASTWPDEMRSDPSEYWQKTANPWHYVTVKGDSYRPADAPAEGDALTALAQFRAILLDPKRTDEAKRVALRFIVHIIGDLHQPLHAGDGTDRGGNDVRVEFLGRSTNLHAVWDSGMIEQRTLSYSEYAAWLSRTIDPADVIAWSKAGPEQWVSESVALRRTIYPEALSLSYSYVHQHRNTVDKRLQQAGVRIAGYFNALFADPIAAQRPNK